MSLVKNVVASEVIYSDKPIELNNAIDFSMEEDLFVLNTTVT